MLLVTQCSTIRMVMQVYQMRWFKLGKRNLLIDMQGNWGNIYTGDKAAASRYIEARLSKFALEVVFNPKLPNWQLSYDGRKKNQFIYLLNFHYY